MFFNMYSFTKFISLLPHPVCSPIQYCLSMPAISTYYALSTACLCLLATMIHRLKSNHTPPACGVVPNRHSTIGDGFIQHKTLNTEWWFVNTTQVYHGGGGGFNIGFSSLHCEIWMWNNSNTLFGLTTIIWMHPENSIAHETRSMSVC